MKTEQLQEAYSLLEKIKKDSLQLNNLISSFKDEEIKEKFLINNLKKMSLQFLDLFVSMQKQINLLINTKNFNKNLNRR